MKYIYTSVLGVFVLDNNFSVIKERKIENLEPLDKGEWTNEERSMIDLFKKDDEIFFIGQKEKPMADIKFTTDENIINKVIKAAKHSYDKHFELTKKLTKKQLSESFSKEFLLIQAINAINELEKSINLLAKRVREMYAVYAPEIERKLTDNDSFIHLIITKDKQQLFSELQITESMGCDVPKHDVDNMLSLADAIYKLIQEKIKKEQYLEELVTSIAPNTVAICGPKIASKLIAIAGSMRKLAFFPAGTIQTLGAEKALFDHLKNKSSPPKYGILMTHPLVMKTHPDTKGKVARQLANKILIAAKVDYFSPDNNYIGYQLMEALEEKNK
jgi:nucleolar protein 56